MCQKVLGIRDIAINIHVLNEFSFRGYSLTTICIVRDIRLNVCLGFTGIMLLNTELTISASYEHMKNN